MGDTVFQYGEIEDTDEVGGVVSDPHTEGTTENTVKRVTKTNIPMIKVLLAHSLFIDDPLSHTCHHSHDHSHDNT